MPRPDLPSFNAADPQDVAAGARMEELRQRLERNDLVVALKIAEVRRVLFRILDQSGVFSDVYIPDPMELACPKNPVAIRNAIAAMMRRSAGIISENLSVGQDMQRAFALAPSL